MTTPLPPPRRALTYAAWASSIVILGLATRRFPHLLPSAWGKYPGDALWALMVFCLWGIVRRRASTRALALTALATAWAVEFSQHWRPDWLVALRSTTVGHLVLGSEFHWHDLWAYAIGVALGVFGERWFARSRTAQR